MLARKPERARAPAIAAGSGVALLLTTGQEYDDAPSQVRWVWAVVSCLRHEYDGSPDLLHKRAVYIELDPSASHLEARSHLLSLLI